MIKAIQIKHNSPEILFQYVAKAGYTHVGISFGEVPVFLEDDWEQSVLRIRKVLETYGLRCVQTHLPYYYLKKSSNILDPDMEASILRCIEATAMLGAKYTAMHLRTAVEDDYSRTRSYEDNKKAICSYLPVLESSGVVLALENLPIFPGDHKKRLYSWDYEDLCQLADHFSSDHVKICWDFGHAHLTGLDQVRALECISKRLVCTHIHNNYGNGDQHLLPAFGTIQWESILPTLKKIQYQGPLTLETVLDAAALETYLAYSYQSISHIEQLIMEGTV